MSLAPALGFGFAYSAKNNNSQEYVDKVLEESKKSLEINV